MSEENKPNKLLYGQSNNLEADKNLFPFPKISAFLELV
jgi:hypothetical protein